MSDLLWNYYTVARVEKAKAQVFPGDGGYTQEQVRSYLERYILDNTTARPEAERKSILAYWGELREGCVMSSVYPQDHLGLFDKEMGQELAVLYPYPTGLDPREAAWAHFTMILGDVRSSLRLPRRFRMAMPDNRVNIQAMHGRIAMRVSLLMEEAGIVGGPKPLWPYHPDPLEQYLNSERVFETVLGIALAKQHSEEIRHEACYLVYQITAHVRTDLFSRAEDAGVPLRSDPELTWNQKTSPSKEW